MNVTWAFRDASIINAETGKVFRLDSIKNCTVEWEPKNEKIAAVGMRSDINPSTAGEIICKSIIDPLTLLYILTGKKISNNWLKMHGGVMRRRKR